MWWFWHFQLLWFSNWCMLTLQNVGVSLVSEPSKNKTKLQRDHYRINNIVHIKRYGRPFRRNNHLTNRSLQLEEPSMCLYLYDARWYTYYTTQHSYKADRFFGDAFFFFCFPSQSYTRLNVSKIIKIQIFDCNFHFAIS